MTYLTYPMMEGQRRMINSVFGQLFIKRDGSQFFPLECFAVTRYSYRSKNSFWYTSFWSFSYTCSSRGCKSKSIGSPEWPLQPKRRKECRRETTCHYRRSHLGDETLQDSYRDHQIGFRYIAPAVKLALVGWFMVNQLNHYGPWSYYVGPSLEQCWFIDGYRYGYIIRPAMCGHNVWRDVSSGIAFSWPCEYFRFVARWWDVKGDVKLGTSWPAATSPKLSSALLEAGAETTWLHPSGLVQVSGEHGVVSDWETWDIYRYL